MKTPLILALLLAAAAPTLSAQNSAPAQDVAPAKDTAAIYRFTDVVTVPVTPVKDQSSSGTCWSFAGLGFIESELLRMGKGEYDLSEMFVVRHAYYDKAVKYVRMHGRAEFAAGGANGDVLDVITKYGIVPNEVYDGLGYGTDKHRHGELDAALRAYVDAIVSNPNRTLTTKWTAGIDGILDAYLGEVPEKFMYRGVEYTPKSFAESLDIDADDYISFSSFIHHPFYEEFILEVPDNWAWGTSWNIPIEELMATVDNALEHGYPVSWGADVSEQGFRHSKGFAVAPTTITDDMNDSERAKWEALADKEKQTYMSSATEPVTEVEVTQQLRQSAFDNYETTDDHAMLLTGIARDQRGERFYKVKNSWGTKQLYGGFFYASVPFVAYKTMDIMLHKDAVPRNILKKLGK